MTNFLNVKNNAISGLASAITSGATSLTVISGDGSKFPSSNFNITIDDEILNCSSRSGDVLTVSRAQEDTTASAHAVGAIVSLNLTAKQITDLNTAVNTIEDNVSTLQSNVSTFQSNVSEIQNSFGKSAGINRSTNQTVPNNTETEVSFDVKKWDYDNMVDLTTYPTRLTCKTAGLYLLTGFLSYNANITGRRVIWIQVNGSTTAVNISQMAVTDSGIGTNMGCACLYFLNVNDYVTLKAKQASGGDLTLLAGYPLLCAARIV
jgi:hypothetical protein